MSQKYSDKQKVAYYKKQARLANQKVVSGKGAYKVAPRNKVKSEQVKSIQPYNRRAQGRGDYVMNDNDSFGRRYGGYLGSKAGEFLGGWAQRVMGLGDYEVNKNVFAGRLPEVTNLAGNGGTVIRFQEYLGDVITSSTIGAFSIDSFMLNAANENTFPWLSQIAANYDQFEFQGVLFEFRSTSATALNSTNTALGTVMMATQYDTVDTPFASKAEMLNYEFSTSCVPSSNQMHMIECDPHQTPLPLLFTESSESNPANTDPRLYFLGRFQIATTGFQAASVNIGELHVTYQVKLLKPKLVASLALTNGFYWSLLTGVDATNPLGLGDDAVYDSIGNLSVATNRLLWQGTVGVPKKYQVDISYTGTVGVTPAYPALTGTNGATVSASPYGSLQIPNAIAGITRMHYQFYVDLASGGVNPTITFANTLVQPTGTQVHRISVAEVPIDS